MMKKKKEEWPAAVVACCDVEYELIQKVILIPTHILEFYGALN